MLLFELFPFFVALVSIVAGVWLFMLNREASADGGPPRSGSSETGPHDQRTPAHKS